jgi:hypothetical protein
MVNSKILLFLCYNNHAMKRIFNLTALLFCVIIYSCVGHKGDDGMNGFDGRDGRDANVGVAIYDIEPNDWVGDENGYVTTLIVPEITEDIYYEGAVLVYMFRDEASEYKSFNQLPYTWLDNNITEYIDFDAYISEIDITLRWVDNGVNSTEAPTGLYTFKVVVIEGYTLSVLDKQFDLTNSQMVLDYFSESDK